MIEFADLIDSAGARFWRREPEQLFEAATGPIEALWRIWAVGLAFVRHRNPDDAVAFVGMAMRRLDEAQATAQTLLKGELSAVLGIAQNAEGNFRDARATLEEAERRLRELTDVALAAIDRPRESAAYGFSQQICRLASALEASESILPREPRFWEGELRHSTVNWLVSKWFREHFLSVRAEVTSTLVRLLAREGRQDEAMRVWHETTDWIEARYISPPLTPKQLRSVPKHMRERLQQPQIDFSAAVPLWQLYMAEGDLDVAAGKTDESIAAFDRAASCISVITRTDLFRLMESKFSKANSLLRMGRLDEADTLYREVEDGFAEAGDPGAIEAVRNARNVLNTKRRERTRAERPSADDSERARLVQEYLASLRDDGE